jgi:predicted DNA-binding transcriptional regulator AlpA
MTSDLSNACPDRLLKLPQVCDMIGRSRASIYRDVATKAFPEPLKVGGSSRWLLSEVQAYIAQLPRGA